MKEPDVNEIDTTMSFVLKIRHKAWIKKLTDAARQRGEKTSDSETVRRILDEAMQRESERAA